MNNETIEQSPLVTLPIWKLFMNYAVPSVITVLFFGVQNIIDGLIVSHYVGEYALGGVNIIMPLYSVIMVIALIVGIGSQALVSQGLGEKNLTKAQNGMSSDVAQLATQGLHIYAFVFLVIGLNILITAYFTALGAAKYSLIIAALHSLVFVLIGIAILPRIFGVDGIWLTSVVAETLTVFIGLKLVSIVNRKI